MKRLFVSVLFLLISATSVFAIDVVVPEQKIIGAETPIALGELIELKLSPVTITPKHLVSSSSEWDVVDLSDGKSKKLKTDSDTGGVFFGGGIQYKNYLAICSVTHLYVNKEGDKIKDIATRTVILRTQVTVGTKPTPTPPTPVPPTPTPVVIPDGQYKVARAIYDLSMKVPAVSREKGAKALANSFRGISSAIAGGAFKSSEDPLKDVLIKTKLSNQTALKDAGISLEDWGPVFAGFTDSIYPLYQSGKATTTAEFKTIWDEIVVGLEAVR